MDTANLQWWEERGRRSGLKHTEGLWELPVGQDKMGFCQNEGWHVEQGCKESSSKSETDVCGHGSSNSPACVEMLT